MNRRALLGGLLASVASAAIAPALAGVWDEAAHKRWVDASWFGLHPDADEETNTRALQAAVDFIENLGGGDVRIPPGQYQSRLPQQCPDIVVCRGSAPLSIAWNEREGRS